jgi:sugar phosphate isomerase/epimerase
VKDTQKTCHAWLSFRKIIVQVFLRLPTAFSLAPTQILRYPSRMDRRAFLRSSLASSLALPAFAAAGDCPYRSQIGIQLYTLRNELDNDANATLAAVAEAGYHQVEAYGFPGNAPMIQIAKDLGLAVHSSHFDWESVTNPDKEGVTPFPKILEAAAEAGLSHLVIPYLHGHERANLDAYRQIVGRCNQAAQLAAEAGIQLAYHNHQFEFQPLDGGVTGFQIFTDDFIPEMKFEIDVFWVAVGGVRPAGLIRELEGRVSQLHLKDLKAGLQLPEFGRVPEDSFQPLGKGIIPMAAILEAATAAGVSHCHVEQDHSPDPIADIRASVEHLATL